MKVTLEFNLPEDEEEFRMSLEGKDYNSAIVDILEILRREIKYKDYPEKIDEVLLNIRNEIYDKLANYGIKI